MIITNTHQLDEFISPLLSSDYITIDTEFLRDKTYYPKLCLVQLSGPDCEAFAIDPLSADIDLTILFELLMNKKVLKVFHAARQDLEIFYNITGKIPEPIFDTQVAAMVCGYGEQIGYNNIVNDVCGVKIDKGAQFTDWSRRPLSRKQISYALDDVTYLKDVYTSLDKEIKKRQRTKWVIEEMEVLTAPSTYENSPENSWQRIKIKSHKPKVLSVLREVSALREELAQKRDLPRQRVMRDETVADLAIHPPKNIDELKKIRNIPSEFLQGNMSHRVLKSVQTALSIPASECPKPNLRRRFPQEKAPTLEMLKMLLRIMASEHEVAPKLIATNDQLEELVIDPKPSLPVLKGWRYDVFGHEAEKLMSGKLALTVKDHQIARLELEEATSSL